MLISSHGGGCCGVAHIFNFGSPASTTYECSYVGSNLLGRGELITTREAFTRLVERWDGHYGPQNPGEGGNRILEAQLVDQQVSQWEEILLEHHFRKIIRYHNRNSGNYVTMFIRHTGGYDFFNPNDATTGAVRPAPVTAPVRDIRVASFWTPSASWEPMVVENRICLVGPRFPSLARGRTIESNIPEHLALLMVNPPQATRGDINTLFTTSGSSAGLDSDCIRVKRLTVADARPHNLMFNRFRPVVIVGEVPPTLPVAPVEAPEPVATVTEYFAKLRADNHRRGPFTTLEDAREAYPRCMTFFRSTVMSDGRQIVDEI